MQSQAHPLFLLYLIAAAQGAFLLLALHYRSSAKKGVQLSQTIFLGVLSYHILYFGLTWSGFLKYFPALIATGMLATAMIPVSWYFYQRRLTKGKATSWKDSLHFGFVLYLMFYVLLSLNIPTDTKLEYYEQQILSEQTHQYLNYLINLLIVVVQSIYYLLITFKRLINHPKQNVRRLLYWFIGFISLLSIHFICCALGTAGYAISYCALVALEGIMVYHIAWQNLRPALESNSSPTQQTNNITPSVAPTIYKKTPTKKYQKSNLAKANATLAATQLTNLMTNQRLFLQSDLRQADLAKAVNLSRHQLSEVLTQELHTNYYDFVNRYRIKYAQELLEADTERHKTMMAIAYEAGFNSKNAFNNAFKKFTSTTPSAYQKTQLP